MLGMSDFCNMNLYHVILISLEDVDVIMALLMPLNGEFNVNS